MISRRCSRGAAPSFRRAGRLPAAESRGPHRLRSAPSASRRRSRLADRRRASPARLALDFAPKGARDVPLLCRFPAISRTDRANRARCGLVGDHAIAKQRHGFAPLGVYVDQCRITGRLPSTAAVLEVADQLLLPSSYRRKLRDSALDAGLRLGVDVFELGVAIGVLLALDRLVGYLQAVAVLAQQLGHRLLGDRNGMARKQLA
jgi:hypothetical protein